MRRLFLFTMMCGFIFMATAQKNAPKWLDKQKKAIVSITTFNKDNKTLQTGTGFFVTESGEILSGYTLFKGAERATVTDTDGNTYPVTSIIGADDLYDVIRLKVNVPKKVAFFTLAAEPLAQGSKVYLVPYSTDKKGTFKEGVISEVSKLKDQYSYYKTSIPFDSFNMPFLTETGQVIGLMQDDAAGDKTISYAVSAGYVNSLHVNSVDALNSTYTNIGIRKAWAQEPDQAQVMLYLMSGNQDASAYLETLNDFIANFPNNDEGYLNRASHYAYKRSELASVTSDNEQSFLDKALADFDNASKVSNDKSNVLYSKARLIFDIVANDTTLTDKSWSLAAAMTSLQDAINISDQPLYHQLEGDIYLTLGVNELAYDSYMKVNASEMASSTSYYWAAKAKEQIPGANISEIITLLDSAIVKTGTTPTQETLAYLLERVDYKMKLSLYEEAVKDYDLYFSMLNGEVGDGFYYYREQAKFRSGDFNGALEDIQAALRLTPEDPNYIAEEASVYMRLENYNEALKSLDKALAIAPDFASCYRLKGVCYVRMDKKSEACTAFEKGKELGDPLVDRLIREHCK